MEVGRIILERTEKKQNHLVYFSSNFSIKENYLQTGRRGTNMVKMEQRLKINEEIVREHLATFNDLKLERDQRATFQTTKELRQITLLWLPVTGGGLEVHR